jgi:SAM-dependent methyltransferase
MPFVPDPPSTLAAPQPPAPHAQTHTLAARRTQVLAYVDQVPLPRAARVLSLGFHDANWATDLAERGCQVSTLGPQSGDGNTGSTASLGDLESINHPDDAFDLVIVADVLELIEWDRWLLQEVRRVLKPGGHAIVSVPNAQRLPWSAGPLFKLTAKLDNRTRRYAARLRHLLGGPAPTPPNDPKVDARTGRRRRFYARDELTQVFERLDFSVVTATSSGLEPLPWVGRARTARHLVPRLAERGERLVLLARKPDPSRSPTRLHVDEHTEARLDPTFVQGRDAWLARHPQLKNLAVDEWTERDFPQRVLVFSPHPDDELIACGGTVARMQANGTQATVVQISCGDKCHALRHEPQSVRETLRPRESEDVAELMGFHELVLWREHDRAFPTDAPAVQRMAELIQRVRPGLIFLPFVHDPHPDHISTNLMLAQAVHHPNVAELAPRIAGCEIATLIPANRLCVIDDTWDLKCRGLMRYRAGMKAVDFIALCELHHAWHAWRLRQHRGLVEIFYETSAEAYADLVLASHGCRLHQQPQSPVHTPTT